MAIVSYNKRVKIAPVGRSDAQKARAVLPTPTLPIPHSNLYAVCPFHSLLIPQIQQELDTKNSILRRNCVEKNTVNSGINLGGVVRR